MKQYIWKSVVPLGLCFAISFDGLLPPAFAQVVPTRIDIVIVEGEGATSGMRQPVSKDPVIRIEDEDHRPVPGVAVVFALPVSGPSGDFTNGAKTLTVVTDNNGAAAAHGLKTNEVPGKLQIYVTASYHGLRARALINQLVEAPPGTKPRPAEVRSSKSGGKAKWVVLGILAAGGAGAGIYLSNRNSNSASTPPTISINTGTVVFGSPR